jgi:N-methylhydantoinase A/oxoprolinase/acetone carboxylase beta subunit
MIRLLPEWQSVVGVLQREFRSAVPSGRERDVMSLRIGVDVGGTNTDAVLMDGPHVIAKTKTPTTHDVTSGIATVMRHVLDASGTPTNAISGVMIGTTHFTNAVIERQRLEPTAAIRLGLPATLALPPMVDWPDDLAGGLGRHVYLCHGGYEFDGRPITPLDAEEIRAVAQDIAAKGITAIAVTSVFSPVNPGMEEEAATIIGATAPSAQVTLSSDIGRVGLLERENAAILNACLGKLARETVLAFRQAIAELDIATTLYLTQNDGTLMSANYAERFPVLTFASGPTNSMRGAAFLSGLKEAIVVDIGGTTTDVGALAHGFPREASIAVEIGGVRTNFRMPDVYSFGLGGG